MKYLELEDKFKRYIGTDHCVATSTGTSSLHLALEALQLPPNSEVIVPEFTMVATAWAVWYARLTPIFVDCTDDLLINIDLIEQHITEKTKVIMITHVYGRIVNMEKIMTLALRYNLRVIEDAAEAHGGIWAEEPAKAYGGIWENCMAGSYDIGCFSFYRNKIIHGEEGGAITTNDVELANIARDMKSMSFGENHNFQHDTIGFNYRMTDSQAQLILNSLNSVEDNIKRREEISRLYDEHLPENIKMPPRNVVWVHDIKLTHSIKDDLVAFLNKNKIAARHSFKPMSAQAPFNRRYDNLNAYNLSQQVCYLPVYPDISNNEVINISNLVAEFINN
tara:strand:+ start:1857 stop:2861 length:1005 start_codon:yes stop_codon:yes gene_type:complete